MEPALSESDSTDDRDEIRNCLLLSTVDLLMEEGPGALSLRRLADECDTSTQMIYTLFGGKSGLLDEIYKVGAQFLRDRCNEVSEDLPPRERLSQLMQVYREFALEIDTIYDIMFARSMTGGSVVKRTNVFGIFHDAVVDCIEAGVLRDVDSESLTESLWAAAHGTISLEIAGYFEDSETAKKRYFKVIEAVLEGYELNG